MGDHDAHLALARKACFVCELLDGNPEYPHHIAYRDETAVVFASRFASVRGHLLVAPVRHLAPLPPGLPYERRQAALFTPDAGSLRVPDHELAALAARVGQAF
ncbi:MAG: hypothetical protein ABIQ18_47445 [Umezawaea sp.]